MTLQPARVLVPALALFALFGMRASASHSTAQHQHEAVSTATEPDPADCAFCGGNPSLHVQKMFELERVMLGMYTSLLR